MQTLRIISRGLVYLAAALFVSWLVFTLGGADRFPLISLPLSIGVVPEFVLFFVFAVVLGVAALVQEYLRSRDESTSS